MSLRGEPTREAAITNILDWKAKQGPRIEKFKQGAQNQTPKPHQELAKTKEELDDVRTKYRIAVEMAAKAENTAQIDERTGLLSNDETHRRLAVAAEQTERSSVPKTVLLGDVNGLKGVNDEFGHAAGNKLLRNVGDIINSEVRSVDIAGRIGGDEVLIVLDDTTPQEAVVFWDRVNKKFEREGIRVSAGATLLRAPFPGEKLDNLYSDADKAQYISKYNSKQGEGSQPKLVLFEDLQPKQLANIRKIKELASARPAQKAS